MPKQLLLVDDAPRDLTMLERHLRPLGHELLYARAVRAAPS